MDRISRRALLRTAGALGAATAPLPGAPAADAAEAAAASPSAAPARVARVYLHFNPAEAAFIEAAVARLIPDEEGSPGALAADVPVFLDRQLGGAYGNGAMLYKSGPWKQGLPQQGYQLPFTPAELYRHAIAALNAQIAASEGGRGFGELPADRQDAILGELQAGRTDLGAVPSAVFFSTLLTDTIMGFFADPAYGGNRDMAGWKLVGFPGAYAAYNMLVDRYGIDIDHPPLSIAENAASDAHAQHAAAHDRSHDR